MDIPRKINLEGTIYESIETIEIGKCNFLIVKSDNHLRYIDLFIDGNKFKFGFVKEAQVGIINPYNHAIMEHIIVILNEKLLNGNINNIEELIKQLLTIESKIKEDVYLENAWDDINLETEQSAFLENKQSLIMYLDQKLGITKKEEIEILDFEEELDDLKIIDDSLEKQIEDVSYLEDKQIEPETIKLVTDMLVSPNNQKEEIVISLEEQKIEDTKRLKFQRKMARANAFVDSLILSFVVGLASGAYLVYLFMIIK